MSVDFRHDRDVSLHGLTNDGVPRRTVTLTQALHARGRDVEIVVMDASGDLRSRIDPGIQVVEIGGWISRLPVVRAKRRYRFLLRRRALADYLRERRPSVMVSRAPARKRL